MPASVLSFAAHASHAAPSFPGQWTITVANVMLLSSFALRDVPLSAFG
jgi:hypothetical protein